MADIADRESLEAWLATRPHEDAVLIAARAALRVVPAIATALDLGHLRQAMPIALLRATAAPWIAAVGGVERGEIQQANRAAAAIAGGDASDASAAAAAALSSAASAARAAFGDSAAAADAAAYAVSWAAYAAVAIAPGEYNPRDYDPRNYAVAGDLALWQAAERDAERLEVGMSHEVLAASPLWPGEAPARITEAWETLANVLINADLGWWVWVDWYRARLDGKPVNWPLEEARVLIPNETWEQGSEAVNARIAELIEEHAPRRPPPPEVPPERPAPVHFEMREGVLHRAPAPPPDLAGEHRARAESAHRGLAEALQDFAASGVSNSLPRLGQVLARCRSALGDDFDGLDVVLLGVHAARLQAFADRADEALMPDSAAEIVALNLQLSLFMGQFREWADYVAGIADGLGSEAEEQQAVADASDALATIEQEAPVAIGEDAEEVLSELEEAATPAEEGAVAQPLARWSYLRSVRAALSTLVADISAAAYTGGLDGIKGGTKATVAAAIVAAGGSLAALAAGLPAEFGWLTGVLTFLRNLLP